MIIEIGPELKEMITWIIIILIGVPFAIWFFNDV